MSWYEGKYVVTGVHFSIFEGLNFEIVCDMFFDFSNFQDDVVHSSMRNPSIEFYFFVPP